MTWSVADGLELPAYFTKVERLTSAGETSCRVLGHGRQRDRGRIKTSSVSVERKNTFLPWNGPPGANKPKLEVLKYFSHDWRALQQAVERECLASSTHSAEVPELLVTPILTSGESDNRVNLVFFSDGYTQAEYDKFITDSTKLAWDIAGNTTFATVRPLLNIFAAFAPSNESGIGMGDEQKDTVFGLYRRGTELRGVYYGKPTVARAACDAVALTVGCDYPILLGNDARYGGLGGEFTVVTASQLNGPLVLRHELGHSIIEVGEEYDGGYAYEGVSSAPDISSPDTFKWNHWLSAPPVRAERAFVSLMDYAWTMLNRTTAWATTFESSGTYNSHVVIFSLSGIPDASHLRVMLDGNDLGWAPREAIGQDRWHYRLRNDEPLAAGTHEVKFELLEPGVDGDVETGQGAQLCSVEIIEYGNSAEFNQTVGHVSAYPTSVAHALGRSSFSITNETTYRPTNEGCLMRLVTTEGLCSICIEGLWHSLLRRVDLIESTVVAMPSGSDPLTIDIRLLKLAQLRQQDQDHLAAANHEAYIISWTRDGISLDEFVNKTSISIPPKDASGLYLVHVEFKTDEVRSDPKKLLTASRAVLVNIS
ncbi:IgA peptidase M64-domain-containing protein [Auriculariales sp. MPI-PUGE-AT-0066]|nr:IgA peptidase M64-domain-containing protein [Auriculariales sp. MPI-PUGE-AT-0066]